MAATEAAAVVVATIGSRRARQCGTRATPTGRAGVVAAPGPVAAAPSRPAWIPVAAGARRPDSGFTTGEGPLNLALCFSLLGFIIIYSETNKL